MKKTFALMLTTALCLIILAGCSHDDAKPDSSGTFCRVVCLEEDGLIVDMENVGYVYVKNIPGDLEIKLLDTVVIDFSEDGLKSEVGEFNAFDGRELSYSYVLENPKSIRLADSSAGEPTFG